MGAGLLVRPTQTPAQKRASDRAYQAARFNESENSRMHKRATNIVRDWNRMATSYKSQNRPPSNH